MNQIGYLSIKKQLKKSFLSVQVPIPISLSKEKRNGTLEREESDQIDGDRRGDMGAIVNDLLIVSILKSDRL